MFYLNSTLNFGIPPVLVFELEVYYKVDRLQTGLTAQQKGTTARWYSNKTSLMNCKVGRRREQIKNDLFFVTFFDNLANIHRFCVLRFTAQLFTVYLFNYSNYFYCFYKDGNATKEKVLKGNFQMPI